ncbi:MAG: hypothetical protein NZM00_01435, partial [Anaerolinea sp.]|nr:hypothetical protein [Anaerolinea sp.]
MSTQPIPQTDIAVVLDDRVRLLSALLAATRYPDDEQRRFPHGTHPHARHTRSLMLAHDRHPAVIGLQSILDRGVSLEALFAFALTLRWPDLTADTTPDWLPSTWVITLRNFWQVSDLPGWWQADGHAWSKALDDVQLVLGDFALKPL